MKNKGKLFGTWKLLLHMEFQKEYMLSLKDFLIKEKKNGKIIYPPHQKFFYALHLTKFEDVKVIILGQDPYFSYRQANGLSFSVQFGTRIPPSLQNIFKEIYTDLGHPFPSHGCLESWAKQGVLLLNSVLSVEKNYPGSHIGKGWEIFTDYIIKILNSKHKNLIFLLWGNYAKKKKKFIDGNKHYILTSSHPSPFSAHKGFLGNKHFSKTNKYLKNLGKIPINWDLNSI